MRALIALTFCIVTAAPFAAMAQELPSGPGDEIVERACQNCHGLDQVTSTHHDADGWRATITQMMANGAVLTDAEQDAVVKYLSANFGFAPPAAPPAPAAAAPR